MMNSLWAILLLMFLSETSASILPPSEYWQVTPSLNFSDVLYAGWEQIPVEKEVLVYNGSLIGRTVS